MGKRGREQIQQLKSENTSILASIQYAKRIQDALLITRKDLSAIFNEFSIVYEPKDIVSGDFYYAKQKGDKKILFVGDCTGHGVPGGFMSILCNDYTMRAIFHEEDPSSILALIEKYLSEGLNQAEINDGMDASVLKVDYSTMKLYFGSANQYGFLIKKDKTITLLKGNRYSLGTSAPRLFPEDYLVQVNDFEKGDLVYMFTDGFRDQINEEGKKINKAKFQSLIQKCSSKSVQEQQLFLNEFYHSFKGKSAQIDDVLVLGVRL